MRLFILIACLWTITHSQTPATWWAASDSSQKAFADTVYKIGVKYGDKGHTAVAIPWMESSLGADTDHHENSLRNCGLSEVALRDMGYGPEVFDSLEAGTLSLEREIFMALDYFFLCKKRLQASGLSPAEAYFSAYPKYSTGKHWRRFKRRGEVFNMRIRWLKTKFK